jgi:hypothetical protein
LLLLAQKTREAAAFFSFLPFPFLFSLFLSYWEVVSFF